MTVQAHQSLVDNESIAPPPVLASTPRKSSSRFTHFTELDGFRGIAAIAVFFHHVCYTSIEPPGWQPSILRLRTISIAGDAGVDLFFVLSGFLITSLLLAARNKPNYYHDFYWKRALRILPLYSIVLLYVFFAMPHSGGYVLLSALFISNFALFFHVATAGPFWTLAIEEQFYLLWPAFLRRLPVVALRRWALSLALCSVALRLAAATVGHHTYRYTFFHCDGLAAGAYIAFWFYQRTSTSSALSREGKAIGAIFLLGAAFYAPSLSQTITEAQPAFTAAFRQTGLTLLFASFIAYAITHTGERKLSILRARFFTFFGLISYALYMIHLYVMYAYDRFHPLTPGDVPAYIVRFFAILSITVVLCLLSRYLIELPANSLRRFVLRPSPGPEREGLVEAHSEPVSVSVKRLIA